MTQLPVPDPAPAPVPLADPANLPPRTPMDAVMTRRALVEAAARAWTAQLVDLSGRNRLLYYRDLPAGTLDLGSAARGPLASLLGGTRTRLSALYPDPLVLADAARRCRKIRDKARENLEERGIDTLYVAMGMASWTPPAGTTAQPAAPALLQRLELLPRGAAQEDFDLDLAGDPEVSPTLLYALGAEFGVQLDRVAVEAAATPPGGDEPDPALLATALTSAAADVPGFTVAPRVVLGNFSYTKLPMVIDLKAHLDALVAHDLVAAIAGDLAAQALVRARQAPVDPATLDGVPPAAEFLVLDADASQQAVIETVVRGSDCVIQGPPGTGKSQTISNLIASAAAAGLKVLFVAEKRAAIDAVIGRLERAGLADLVLDLHGGVHSRRRLAENLAAALGSARGTVEPESATVQGFLAARRTMLAAHERALNERREPWGVSLYEAQGRALAARRVGLDARLAAGAVDGIGAARLDEAKEHLRALLALGAAAIADGSHPWAAALTMDAAAVEGLSDAATDLARDELPRLRRLAAEAAVEAGLPPPVTAAVAFEQGEILGARAALAGLVRDEAFDVAERLAPLLEPARRGWLARMVANLVNGTYKAALAEARTLILPLGPGTAGPDSRAVSAAASPGRVAAAMADAAALAARWVAAGGRTRLPVISHAAEVRACWDGVTARMTAISSVLPLPVAAEASLEVLEAWARSLEADLGTLRKLPELRARTAALAATGAADLTAAVLARGLGSDDALAALDGAWASAVVERILARDPAAGGAEAVRLDQEVLSFAALDREHIGINAARVKRAWAERAVAARDRWPDQDLLVTTQARRKTGHLPVRDLFAAAQDVLSAIKPCWAMSPLLVSQILPADRTYFDLIIFDEASQILPADAIPAIVRGRRVVVAGDDLQLPPTTFFASQTVQDLDAEEAAAALEGAGESLATGFASILDIADPLLGSRPLRWHYRSRDERLIAFSNLQIYAPHHRELTTFPAATDEAPVRHVLVTAPARAAAESAAEGSAAAAVSGSASGATDGETSAAEVAEVVRQVIAHVEQRPTESLGVIAMGIKHAERIEDAVRAARVARPELEELFAETAREPFFVKNLERVQGDERDAIIISVGYGRTADGRLRHNFGPINQQGGERRLNVAITRARRRLTLVSSFGSADLDPSRSSAEGVRLLRAYLRYAESGGSDLGGAVPPRPAPNGLERDVRDALAEAGIAAVTQLGTSAYYLDFALRHPTRPGTFVLAAECDGPTYGSAPTTRERDRLRRQQLEIIGWHFHRIWSTDWYRDRPRELARLRGAYDGALAELAAAEAEAARRAHEDEVTAATVAAKRASLEALRLGGASSASAASEVAGEIAAAGGTLLVPDGGSRAPAIPAPLAPPAPSASPVPPAGPAAPPRGPRPRVFGYGSVDKMPPGQIDAVVAWIESDGLLRTGDEVLVEAMRELGFARRGPRITAAIEASVTRVRGRRRN